MSAYQTFLKDCDCEHSGILFKDNIACCRWCRKPYDHGGMINYEDEHFQKPQPEIKENKQDVLWTEKEIEDILISALNDRGFGSYKTPHHYIEKSKQSKQPPIAPKTERIEIVGINILMTEGDGKDCHFYTNGDVPKEKLPLIQQAIEKVLNNERIYTQFEVDVLMEGAFNAGRDKYKSFPDNHVYATFQDYFNSLK